MAFDWRTEYHRYQQYYLNLRRFYKTQPMVKVSFFVLLSFFTVVFFSVFAIRPTVTTIGKLVREIEDKRRINQLLDNKLKALDTLQTVMVSIQSEIPLIFAALPADSALGRLMQEFEFVAQRADVALVSVQFQPLPLSQTDTKERSKANPVKFTLTVGGGLENLADFLQTLETLDRVLVFESVEFVSGANTLRQQGINTVVEVKGEAYFLKEAVQEVNSAN